MLNRTIFIRFHKEINFVYFLSFDSAIKDPNGVVNNVFNNSLFSLRLVYYYLYIISIIKEITD